jgi:hypothetical protein
MSHDGLIACVGFAVFALTFIAAFESVRSRMRDDD